MNDENSLFVLCECASPEHQVILSSIFEDEPEYQMVFISFHLVTYRNIFRRVWRSVRYIFGYRSRYGDWDEIMINKKTAKEIRDYLDRFIAGESNKQTTEN